jgi:hypothetical protein
MKLNLPDEIREFFRRKGKLGAKKRQQVLTPEQRQEIARKAAQARWGKRAEDQPKKRSPKMPGDKQK